MQPHSRYMEGHTYNIREYTGTQHKHRYVKTYMSQTHISLLNTHIACTETQGQTQLRHGYRHTRHTGRVTDIQSYTNHVQKCTNTSHTDADHVEYIQKHAGTQHRRTHGTQRRQGMDTSETRFTEGYGRCITPPQPHITHGHTQHTPRCETRTKIHTDIRITNAHLAYEVTQPTQHGHLPHTKDT